MADETPVGQLTTVGEAADRAGSIVVEQVRSILEGAQAHADDALRQATGEAGELQQHAHDSARRVLATIEAAERELTTLVDTLKAENARIESRLDAEGA